MQQKCTTPRSGQGMCRRAWKEQVDGMQQVLGLRPKSPPTSRHLEWPGFPSLPPAAPLGVSWSPDILHPRHALPPISDVESTLIPILLFSRKRCLGAPTRVRAGSGHAREVAALGPGGVGEDRRSHTRRCAATRQRDRVARHMPDTRAEKHARSARLIGSPAAIIGSELAHWSGAHRAPRARTTRST